jgi:hypothetical protein
MEKHNKLLLMKRVVTLITLLLFTGILLPSCGVTVQKRQHTKGFYVNTNPRIPTARSSKEEIRPEEEPAVAVAEAPGETAPATAETKQLAEAVTRQQPAEATPSTVTEDVPTVVAHDRSVAPTTRSGAFQHTDKKPFIERMAEKSPLKKKLDNQKMKARASSGEALSLFWIVILILLLLWAIGVISGGWGLGGVIYILLVIALILLILWLLRIV